MTRQQTPAGLTYLRQLLARRDDLNVWPPYALDYDKPPPGVYFYRPGEVLVPSDQVDLFRRTADEIGLRYSTCCEEPQQPTRTDDEEIDTGDAASYEKPSYEQPIYEQPSYEDRGTQRSGIARFSIHSTSELEIVLRRLEQASDGALTVSPNHVLFGCPVWSVSPEGDPSLPLNGFAPRQLSEDGPGNNVVVAVVDNGLPEEYAENPYLATVVVTTDNLESYDYSANTPVLSYPQGHGSFVCGVVRQVAPGAKVMAYLVLDPDGLTDESTLDSQLLNVLQAKPQVINLSLGATTRGDAGLLSTSQLAQAAGAPGGPIVVAAAGNGASNAPFYPAAEPWTISVGAAQMDNGNGVPVPASFTDFGVPGSEWVDTCAIGVDVTSAYEAHPYKPSNPPSAIIDFSQGFAVWSGTSFATPHVAGVIAVLLQANPNLDRAQILAKLATRTGHQSVAGLGVFVE